LMAYASISTGFNQGTFNSTAPAAPALESETVTAYEIGAKSEWMDSRLRFNANLYFEDFKNLQTQIVTQLLTEDANVGKIEVKGFEFELLAVPVDGLTLGLNYNFNDATYKDYENAVCVEPKPDGSGQPVVCNANGNQVRVSPKHSVGASVMYDLASSVGNFSFALSDSYKSEAFWDYSNTISNDAYHLVSAMVRYAPQDAIWAVSLRGSNLTNSEYWTEVLTRGGEGFMGTPASPRTYSMNVEMHF
jgi:iron complex outermembrane recepter protein